MGITDMFDISETLLKGFYSTDSFPRTSIFLFTGVNSAVPEFSSTDGFFFMNSYRVGSYPISSVRRPCGHHGLGTGSFHLHTLRWFHSASSAQLLLYLEEVFSSKEPKHLLCHPGSHLHACDFTRAYIAAYGYLKKAS